MQHIETLIYVVGVIAAVATVVSGILFSSGQRDWGYWTAFIVVVSTVFSGFLWYQQRMWKDDELVNAKKAEENIKKTETKLTKVEDQYLLPGNRPTPQHASRLHGTTNMPLLLLGRGVVFAEIFPFVVFQQVDKSKGIMEEMLKIDVDSSGRMRIDGKFFNKDGKILTEIENNQVIINSGPVFKIKQTQNTLDLFDDEARKVLTVDFINPRCVRILGDFYLRKGVKISATKDDLSVGFVKYGEFQIRDVGAAFTF